MKNQLHDFDAIWAHEMTWFESPNHSRGGWSGVGKLLLGNGDNEPLVMFVKKQQNYGRRTKLPPFQVEPTFRREFKMLLKLEKLCFGAPKPVYYAEKIVGNQQQAILITVNLSGFLSLDEWIACDKMHLRKHNLIEAIATEIRRFHSFGFVHRALYAKHIFVKPLNQVFEIALIDFEKTRLGLMPILAPISDLITLNYRTDFFSKKDRLYFYKCYFKLDKIGFLHKKLLAYINYKSDIKLRQSKF